MVQRFFREISHCASLEKEKGRCRIFAGILAQRSAGLRNLWFRVSIEQQASGGCLHWQAGGLHHTGRRSGYMHISALARWL